MVVKSTFRITYFINFTSQMPVASFHKVIKLWKFKSAANICIVSNGKHNRGSSAERLPLEKLQIYSYILIVSIRTPKVEECLIYCRFELYQLYNFVKMPLARKTFQISYSLGTLFQRFLNSRFMGRLGKGENYTSILYSVYR